jgi:isocitrate/isopropylmalate dehydrogenase
MTTTITIAYGDGVGPEILEATLHILREAGAELSVEAIEVGKRIYNMDSATGILPSSLHTLEQNRILLKGPSFIPEGECENVTAAICKRFDLSDEHKVIRECDFLPGISATAYVSEYFSLFEPVQNVDMEMKGKNKANPSATILASIMMLEHIGQMDVAQRIEGAWRATIEDGIHTRDIYQRGSSSEKVSTREFADAVVARLFKTSANYNRLQSY